MFILTLTTMTSSDVGIASAPIFGLSLGALIGYGLLAIGVIATALSSQRYLLLYAVAGMLYWLCIEALQSALTAALPLNSWHGYVAAMALSWLPICGWVISRVWRHGAIRPVTKRHHSSHQNRYIEHTPVYDQYQPKFR